MFIQRHRRAIGVAVIGILALAGFFALHAILRDIRLKDVRGALAIMPPVRLLLALGLTITSYAALTLYDRFALAAIGKPLPWRVSALASFTGYAISHNLGFSLLTGGSARYRVYQMAGLDIGDVARVSLLTAAAFWAGLTSVVCIALLTATGTVRIGSFALGPAARTGIGIALLMILAVAPLARALGRSTIRIGPMRLPLPPVRSMGAQSCVAVVDLLTASAALFVLLPQAAPAQFPGFVLVYALAISIALITHVPGGIGIFETTILAAVPGDRGQIFAALLVYRAIYYLLPLIVAACLVAAIEIKRLRKPMLAGLSLLEKASGALAPPLLALLAFLGGFVLLVSGALPAVHWRMTALADIVPLPFIEGSHFAASIAGASLLLIAPALSARLERGFRGARLLLVGGAIFSLAKGFDYEEATVLLVIAAILQSCRPAFYRRRPVPPIDANWLIAAAAALGLSIWAGFFAYKHVAYSHDLWWRLAFDGNSARFLRASAGAAVALLGYAIWARLNRSRPAEGIAVLPDDVAARALASATRSDTALAFTGDKRFLIAASRDAFLMYRVQGATWVIMGDPIGERAAWADLAWTIRDASDAAGGRLCFYQVGPDMLSILIELGLPTMKYGEEAHIALAYFTLSGPQARSLRHSQRKAQSAGLSFEIVPSAEVPAYLGQLSEISDEWLAAKGAREKRFSIGRFDPAYLARFDCAVVRNGNRIAAFANIWRTQSNAELSVDLMRRREDAPYGTMDFLFVSLMAWGRDHGFARFNLGMAPLSGIRGGRLAPLWAKLANGAFHRGDRFYGFTGLRAFKEKFSPVWEPRYIATQGGIATAPTMVDLLRLLG